jgi:hypothetical protein
MSLKYDKCGFWLSIVALIIGIPSLWLSYDAFDITHDQLVALQNNLTSIEFRLNSTTNYVLLKTSSCQAFYFRGSWASCWNGTAWNSCVIDYPSLLNCTNQKWFIEVNQTYSWQNIENGFNIS